MYRKLIKLSACHDHDPGHGQYHRKIEKLRGVDIWHYITISMWRVKSYTTMRTGKVTWKFPPSGWIMGWVKHCLHRPRVLVTPCHPSLTGCHVTRVTRVTRDTCAPPRARHSTGDQRPVAGAHCPHLHRLPAHAAPSLHPSRLLTTTD